MGQIIRLGLISFVILSCSASKKTLVYNEDIFSYRTMYKNGFLENPRSPLTQEELINLDFYPPDLNWKLNCNCLPAEKSVPFEMPTYSGVTRTYIHHSTATCRYKDKLFSLELYQNIHPFY
ncbi:MAG: hypothetical protein H7X99_07670 [Saprospiraceae bacterium]|nr:hypothetical protein [Saprospiraceae bacterium]